MKRLIPALGPIYDSLDGAGYLLVRVTAGAIFAVHGAARMRLIDIGGPTIESSASFLADQGLNPALALTYYITGIEFLGGIFLILGFLTRPVVVLLVAFLVVATFHVTWPNGFFVRGTPKGSGFEYSLLLLALAVNFLIHGGGRFSVDHAIHWEL
jgi:putative oxidoreductase